MSLLALFVRGIIKIQLVRSVQQIKNQLLQSRANLSQVVSSDALQGKVKVAIDNKITNHQIPLVDNYINTLDSIVNRYDRIISLFSTTVNETSKSAIINTEYLERIKQRMKDSVQNIETISNRTKSIYSEIADIISLENPRRKK